MAAAKGKVISEVRTILEHTEDERVFRRYLIEYELVEGSPRFEAALEAWREMCRAQQRKRSHG